MGAEHPVGLDETMHLMGNPLHVNPVAILVENNTSNAHASGC
jgi:hypothetical protein